MSCSLYRYTEKCDGRPCAGDCDLCDYFPDEEEQEIQEVADELFGKIMSGDFIGHCPTGSKVVPDVKDGWRLEE